MYLGADSTARGAHPGQDALVPDGRLARIVAEALELLVCPVCADGWFGLRPGEWKGGWGQSTTRWAEFCWSRTIRGIDDWSVARYKWKDTK